jgi:lysine-N-methylase
MGERMRTILVPQYLKDFRCTGSACEDTCCRVWKVHIDHETYRKYQKIRDEELTGLIEKYIKRNRKAGHTDATYAEIKFLSDTSCPFLDKDCLCKIQLKRGMGYLSDVCETYPRVVNIVNNIFERSATLSCPEAAKVALLNPKEMEFDELEEPYNTRNCIAYRLNTSDIRFGHKPQKYIWELRIFIISLIQNRKIAISDRLIILGMFLKKLQEYSDEERCDEIPVLIGTYVDYLETGVFEEGIKDIPVQSDIQMELLKELAERRFFSGATNKRYFECFAQFLSGINYNNEETMQQNGERYKFAWEKYYEPYMKEHEYILENYLVNYVFATLFPINNKKSIFDTYIFLILHYALVKTLLIGMSGFHKGLTDELVIKLIYSFSRSVSHNQKFVNHMADLLKSKGYDSMSYMAILIKN